MNARKSLSFTWLLAALVWGGLLAEQSAAQKTPMPPRTGTFSVQMFQGNTQFCWIAIWPPSTYTDGTPIPPGTPVQIKAYPSYIASDENPFLAIAHQGKLVSIKPASLI